MLRVLKISICCALSVHALSACDKISTAKVDALSAVDATFAGAEKIVLQSEKSYLLTWPESTSSSSKTDQSFDIYGLKLTDQTKYPPEIFSGAGETVDDTSSYLVASLPDSLSPLGKGTRIGTAINKNTFEVSPSFLNANGTYLFQVRRTTSTASKTKDDNTRVVVFRYGIAATSGATATILANFNGCVSAAANDTSSAIINFKLPTGADKINIFRDVTNIGTIDDPTVTSTIDKGLSQGETYTYTCELTIGTNKKKGTPIPVTIPANVPPVFSGISTATAANARSLTVS